ncbi:16681_t:CDS:2 [Funneliformis geosporum]|uniref:16681_t:CDS:1 n=1 Tax=Funneliformis geosporum TaxID=1117311 RepID=A0A9W4SAP1_9GLOM|nr:16681_t:CDS:2 [Funneliformis geosporum]
MNNYNYEFPTLSDDEDHQNMESETDSQSTENTTNEILKEGSTFRYWDEAVNAGNLKKNKMDKQPESKKISCPWHVNLSLPAKDNVKKLVIVTKFIGIFETSRDEHDVIKIFNFLIKQKDITILNPVPQP